MQTRLFGTIAAGFRATNGLIFNTPATGSKIAPVFET
jgi:hypothetical protein